jgi:tripartite-type tricarboxylate transporter receptor subunit TctC
MNLVRVLALPFLLASTGSLHAQYPSRPINLVVPYSAGSDADLAGRNLAQHAPRYLGGQGIVVVNQPGASGAIGTQAVHKASADGYTLLLARIASQVILPATDRKTPYQWNDFTLLSVLEINFATVGAGTIQNFGAQYLFSLVGLPRDAAVGIPYKGSGDLTAALLAGEVQFACSNLGALLGQFRAGTLRALMSTTGGWAASRRCAARRTPRSSWAASTSSTRSSPSALA